MEGYCSIIISPYKKSTKISGRHSGGIALLYEESYKKFFEVVKSSNNSIWCRISKQTLGKHKDLFICGIYIPPENSTYFNEEIFEKLEVEIEDFIKKGYVMLLGDFNARTGQESDSVCRDGQNFILNDCSNMSFKTSCRNTFNPIVNSHGKRLLDLCKSFDLRILNGRITGDSLGRFTYSTQNGDSTVDYIITDQCLFNSVKYFTVNKQLFLSDHCPISVWIESSIPQISEIDVANLNHLETISAQFVWTENSPESFQNAMKSSKVKTLISNFLSRDFQEGNSETVEEAVHLVESIFTTASTMSLRLRQLKHNKKKKAQNVCHKKWFDFDCRKARKELRKLSNQKHTDPSDPHLRNVYHNKLKSFKKHLKIKKYNFHRVNYKSFKITQQTRIFGKY